MISINVYLRKIKDSRKVVDTSTLLFHCVSRYRHSGLWHRHTDIWYQHGKKNSIHIGDIVADIWSWIKYRNLFSTLCYIFFTKKNYLRNEKRMYRLRECFFFSPPPPRLFIIFSYTVNFLKKYFQKLIELLWLESRMRLFLFIEKYFSLHFSSFSTQISSLC